MWLANLPKQNITEDSIKMIDVPKDILVLDFFYVGAEVAICEVKSIALSDKICFSPAVIVGERALNPNEICLDPQQKVKIPYYLKVDREYENVGRFYSRSNTDELIEA